MILRSAYATVGPVDVETEIERSRFICWLRRVESEDAARTVIADARQAHRQANHHCSAFVVGADAALRRSNDDGEPAGTAGRPMLETLTHAGVSDVVAVVIRYFGGVKLGTGGLARAYSGAVSEALDRAPRIERIPVLHHDLHLSHADAGRVEHALRGAGFEIVDTTYGHDVRLRLAVPVVSEGLPTLLRSLGVPPEALTTTGDGWHDQSRPTH